MAELNRGDEVRIDVERIPYPVHGIFHATAPTSRYLKVVGTIGDDIGRTFLIPKGREILITVISSAKRND